MNGNNYSYITEYYDWCVKNKNKVSKKVILAYKHLIERLDKGKNIYYNDKKANHCLFFIENFCKNSKGRWGGKKLELLLWQKAMICAVFGVMNKETDKRQFKKLVLYVGRKNGKSVVASAIANYLLTADGEMGAEIYSVATKKNQ